MCATSYTKGGIYKNKPDGKICAPARKLWPIRTNSFSRSEKINEVNKDFKLCFHVDVNIYIKYSTLNMF